MSIIAVHGFPMKFSLADAVKKLARPINGNFEALNFLTPKGQGSIKSKILRTCYIRLSDKLDPVRVVEQINSYEFATKLQYKAYIPDVVPDLPLSKPKRLPLKIRSALNITDDETHDQVLLFATQEILLELQIKYPGLYSLSKKYQHKLLQNLSKKLYSRVKELADGSSELDSCMKMTRAYRRAYPHFGDFQLVLDMHHEVQDGAGVPRTHLQEADIAATPPTPLALDMPLQKLRPLRNKCTERVLTKMTDHIKSLDAEINPTDDEEKIARKQVRQELKKLLPFLPTIVNQMMDKHLMPQDGPMCRVRIYGEPYLPNKDVLGPFLSKYKPVHVMRSTRMYNLIKFSVPPALYHQLTAMNGTVLNGAKLVIRSSDMAEFKGVSTALGLTSQQNEAEEEEEDVEDEAMEEDQEVNWDEEL